VRLADFIRQLDRQSEISEAAFLPGLTVRRGQTLEDCEQDIRVALLDTCVVPGLHTVLPLDTELISFFGVITNFFGVRTNFFGVRFSYPGQEVMQH